MLAVDPPYRRHGIGRKLVRITLETMYKMEARQAMLETELDNIPALNLYQCNDN